MKRILSFGAGVNSFALLAMARKGELRFDYILFADTGCEHPETYEAVERIAKPVARTMGVPFVHLKPVVEGTDSLYNWCWKHRIIPLRAFRTCTAKWKLRPIRKWLRENIGLGNEEVCLGIAWEERSRANRTENPMNMSYPLIERRIDRAKCVRIIEEAGWPVPPKSGCYVCPFQRLGAWKALFRAHPDLFLRAEALEKNSHKYLRHRGEGTLYYEPLEQVRLRMDDKSEEGCLDGYLGGRCGVCTL